ncbi:unnamed protein product [Caenorhabditis bovis]|uniref:Uncharacterized protein n=1 Tax=Caenorhabditis bovis TaxID=2654633 RepID=A0A8S1EV53_9PELO|nr:unnamed protein product [Caenorhabditis bovis]
MHVSRSDYSIRKSRQKSDGLDTICEEHARLIPHKSATFHDLTATAAAANRLTGRTEYKASGGGEYFRYRAASTDTAKRVNKRRSIFHEIVVDLRALAPSDIWVPTRFEIVVDLRALAPSDIGVLQRN